MKENLRFVPPDYLWGFIILQIIFNYVFPIKKIIFYPYTLLGILFILAGIYPNLIWGPIVFRREKTTTRPHHMPNAFVTYGLFKYTRNPTYLGMALTLFGVSILLGSLSTFILPILFIILTDTYTIPVEEKNMEKVFGKKYLKYKNKVRRWI